jgi:hypothetical protein
VQRECNGFRVRLPRPSARVLPCAVRFSHANGCKLAPVHESTSLDARPAAHRSEPVQSRTRSHVFGDAMALDYTPNALGVFAMRNPFSSLEHCHLGFGLYVFNGRAMGSIKPSQVATAWCPHERGRQRLRYSRHLNSCSLLSQSRGTHEDGHGCDHLHRV